MSDIDFVWKDRDDKSLELRYSSVMDAWDWPVEQLQVWVTPQDLREIAGTMERAENDHMLNKTKKITLTGEEAESVRALVFSNTFSEPGTYQCIKSFAEKMPDAEVRYYKEQDDS